MTPAAVHYGQAEQIHARRAQVLSAAYARHPERFVRRPPLPPDLPGPAWINPPAAPDRAAVKSGQDALKSSGRGTPGRGGEIATESSSLRVPARPSISQ
jgi:hypothetical protein